MLELLGGQGVEFRVKLRRPTSIEQNVFAHLKLVRRGATAAATAATPPAAAAGSGAATAHPDGSASGQRGGGRGTWHRRVNRARQMKGWIQQRLSTIYLSTVHTQTYTQGGGSMLPAGSALPQPPMLPHPYHTYQLH